MEELLRNSNIATAMAACDESDRGAIAPEFANPARALLYGWWKCRAQDFFNRYEILLIEKEVEIPLSPTVNLYARADAVVKDRNSGRNFVFNWKTIQSLRDWQLKWQMEVQAWTEAFAMEPFLEVPVHGCFFEGFEKGGKDKEGKWTSPLMRGFINEDGDVSHAYQRGKSWTRFDAWETSLTGWIDELPPEEVSSHFERSVPIMRNDEIVREWLEQIVREEEDLQRIMESDVPLEDHLRFFKQRWGFWRCAKCPYLPLCQKQYGLSEAVESGLFRLREKR